MTEQTPATPEPSVPEPVTVFDEQKADKPSPSLTDEERELTIPPEDDVPEEDDDPEVEFNDDNAEEQK